MTSYTLKNKRSLFILANYFFGYLALYPLLINQLIRYFRITDFFSQQLILGLFYLLFLAVTIILAYPLLSDSFKRIKGKVKKITFNCFTNMLLLYLTNIICVTILFLIFKTDTITSANQTSITTAIQDSPFVYLPVAIIFAPIVEETVFRGVIYRKLRKYTPYIVTAIIVSLMFGLLHIFDSLLTGNYADLIALPVYFIESFYICRVYETNDNIIAPMILHCLLNTIAIILTFFI